MNRKTNLLPVFAAVALMTALPTAHGQFHADNFYFKADIGGNWMPDTDLEAFFGEDVSGAKVEFEPGLRLGLGVGYNFTEWFGAEFELGLTSNEIDWITGATSVDAVVGTAPFLVNVKFQLPTRTLVTPYVGAGVGGASVFIDADPIDYGNTIAWGSDATLIFAAQAFGGLRFKINEDLGVRVEYRYATGSEAEFDADDWSYYEDAIHLGRLEVHSVSLSVDFRF